MSSVGAGVKSALGTNLRYQAALLSKPVALLLLRVAADFGLCLAASLLPVMLLLQMSQPQVSTHLLTQSRTLNLNHSLTRTHSFIRSLSLPLPHTLFVAHVLALA